MILVFLNMLGVKIEWMLLVFGYDYVFYGYVEIYYDNVCVLVFNMFLGEGKGFVIV